jgi:ribonuclease P protein component
MAVGSLRRADAKVVDGLPSDRRLDFPASARLKRRADYQKVYKHGVRVTGRHVVLFLLQSREHEGRFGVTASRRIGGAVARSRAKRRLRELYRLQLRDGAGGAHDIVANARRSSATAPWSELEEDFKRCLRRGRLLTAGHRRDGAPAMKE